MMEGGVGEGGGGGKAQYLEANQRIIPRPHLMYVRN